MVCGTRVAALNTRRSAMMINLGMRRSKEVLNMASTGCLFCGAEVRATWQLSKAWCGHGKISAYSTLIGNRVSTPPLQTNVRKQMPPRWGRLMGHSLGFLQRHFSTIINEWSEMRVERAMNFANVCTDNYTCSKVCRRCRQAGIFYLRP